MTAPATTSVVDVEVLQHLDLVRRIDAFVAELGGCGFEPRKVCLVLLTALVQVVREQPDPGDKLRGFSRDLANCALRNWGT